MNERSPDVPYQTACPQNEGEGVLWGRVGGALPQPIRNVFIPPQNVIFFVLLYSNMNQQYKNNLYSMMFPAYRTGARVCWVGMVDAGNAGILCILTQSSVFPLLFGPIIRNSVMVLLTK